MQSIIRSTRLAAQSARPVPGFARITRRYASQSYGDSQSGHQKADDAPNPKEHLEHPGPKSPTETGTSESSSQSQSSGSSGSSGSKSASNTNSSSGAKPAIHQPGPPPETKDADVEAHNKEMENRSDRTANQLQESDNKVHKKFWKGDVGPKTGEEEGQS